jgi:hypothetical protein
MKSQRNMDARSADHDGIVACNLQSTIPMLGAGLGPIPNEYEIQRTSIYNRRYYQHHHKLGDGFGPRLSYPPMDKRKQARSKVHLRRVKKKPCSREYLNMQYLVLTRSWKCCTKSEVLADGLRTGHGYWMDWEAVENSRKHKTT